jgi:hypothetical protein
MLAGRELITRLTGGQFERDRKAIGIDQCMNLTGHHLVTCPRTVFVPSDASSVLAKPDNRRVDHLHGK